MDSAKRDSIIYDLRRVKELILGSDVKINRERLSAGDFSAVQIQDEMKMNQAYLALFEIFRKLEELD